MKFNESGIKALSAITADIAQIFFAAFVAAAILPIETYKIPVLILELGLSLGFWFASIKLAQKGKL